MSRSGSGFSGTYQSAGTSSPSPGAQPQSIRSVELRTVTVLPGGSTGGPPTSLDGEAVQAEDDRPDHVEHGIQRRRESRGVGCAAAGAANATA